ncbi:hypothetical protein CQA86_22290 [Klebsiella pneumoniae]|nr:hypothetical protein CQA86_22290 [Klebsiella pneumoniae]
MMSLWDALRMNMMISYQELVRTFLSKGSKRQLDYLVSQNEMKINELIEMLINDAYTKAKLKSWEN